MTRLENYNALLDKLSLQVSSFQEGFRILSDSRNIQDIGKNFVHLLRGNLFVSDVNLFHKQNEADQWHSLFIQKSESESFVSFLRTSEAVSLNFENDREYKVYSTLRCIDNSYFGLIIGKKIDKTEFNALDAITLQIFTRLLDNAYQSHLARLREKNLIFSLNHKVLQLNSLVDTGIEISKLENNTQLLELALERAVALTNASKGIMRIVRDEKVIATLRLPNTINVAETLKSTDKIETQVDYRGYSYIVTLVDKESRDGNAKFDNTDEILLTAFARQVHSAVENKELHKEALENETIKKELSVASTIQKKIIPETLPVIEGYEIAGINISSKEVGGDYYDCRILPNGKVALVMADVAGKGVPASLLVSSLSASLHAYLETDISLDELAVKLNKIIYQSSTADKFITCFISILNPPTGELDIINAGHNPSLHLRQSKLLEKIEAGGIALGMFDMGLPFKSEKRKIEEGERILMFTDGIPEAMNEYEDEYSDERLEKFCLDNCFHDADKFINELVADVRSFTKDTPQSDDITALYLIRKS
ncbi:serine phosphatase rsbu, regulator of sigma subunit [hydrocarbon metagenome]|uniref:Serine phosphatase rsbu, regulator of sigma subunit n=1 Tax=hydrocarbon metagenome TaxID=938273 RepID=A0A0W8FWC9_9ZZZZ